MTTSCTTLPTISNVGVQSCVVFECVVISGQRKAELPVSDISIIFQYHSSTGAHGSWVKLASPLQVRSTSTRPGSTWQQTTSEIPSLFCLGNEGRVLDPAGHNDQSVNRTGTASNMDTATPQKGMMQSLKFVGHDHRGRPLKRKQVSHACDACKRKKVRLNLGQYERHYFAYPVSRNAASMAPTAIPIPSFPPTKPSPSRSSWSASPSSPTHPTQPPLLAPAPDPRLPGLHSWTMPPLFWATSTPRASLSRQL